MTRLRAGWLLVSIVAVASGCLGVPPPAPQQPTMTSTPDYHDCPYTLHAVLATDDRHSRVDHVIEYRDLAPERQAEFRTAPETDGVNLGAHLPSTWAGPRIITYRGDQYYTVAQTC